MKKKEKHVEKRIYAVVADTVWTPEKNTVVQIAGRQGAQVAHAVSRMKMHNLIALFWTQFSKFVRIAIKHIRNVKELRTAKGLSDFRKDMEKVADEKITLIILSCRDGKELKHLQLLLANERIKHYTFEDENEVVYGPGEVVTAFATVPIDPEQTIGILDYLPLWTPKPPE